jgi:hypothetical protein
MPEGLTKGIAGIPLGFSTGGIYQDPTPLTRKLSYGPDTLHSDEPDPTSDAFSDPATYEQANPFALGIMSVLTGGALGTWSLPSLAFKAAGLYNTVSNFFGDDEAKTQNMATFGLDPKGEFTGIGGPAGADDTSVGANAATAAANAAAAAEAVGFTTGEDVDTIESEMTTEDTPGEAPSGDPSAAGSPAGPGSDPSSSPWNIGGFVDTGYQMGGLASLRPGANALQDYVRSKLNLSNGIGGYGPVLGNFG